MLSHCYTISLPECVKLEGEGHGHIDNNVEENNNNVVIDYGQDDAHGD